MAMQNLDINLFTERSGVDLEGNDRLLLVTSKGNDGCVKVSLIKSQIIEAVKPSINATGMWLVGEMETGVQAVGKTPQLKQDPLGILWKYDTDTEWQLLVPWSEIKFTFDELTEAQKDELTPTLEDFSEEEIAELQKPAVEMIGKLQATDAAVSEAEALRVEAENLRVEAETARAEAETLRAEEELLRVETETVRVETEKSRTDAEAVRVANENIRIANESSRKAAESDRSSAEDIRISNENVRKKTETARVSAEDNRTANENKRKASENERVSAENTRISNEDARKNAETNRANAETAREENESERMETDTARKNDYAVLREDIVAATKDAWAASAEVRNIPIIKDGTWWVWDVDNDEYKDSGSPATSRSPQIQNGTWWIWDDSNGVYVDTGQAVNSTFQLTKEKIEGVFTGNITTHWHDRYVDKEEGKGLSSEDFTTQEKEKLAALENYNDTNVRGLIQDVRDSIPTKVSELENDSSYASKEELVDGLSTKQNLNWYFTGLSANEWVLDGTYRDFKWRCDLKCPGVTDAMYAEVVFSVDESSSGDYAPVCETGLDVVRIWSNTNASIIIPTVVISR